MTEFCYHHFVWIAGTIESILPRDGEISNTCPTCGATIEVEI